MRLEEQYRRDPLPLDIDMWTSRPMVRAIHPEARGALIDIMALAWINKTTDLHIDAIRNTVGRGEEIGKGPVVPALIRSGAIVKVNEDGDYRVVPLVEADAEWWEREKRLKERKNRKKRKGMKRKREPISTKLRFTVLERSGFRCDYCGVAVGQSRLHVDHIIPVSKGGTNELDNLCCACDTCNFGKRDRVLRALPGEATA